MNNGIHKGILLIFMIPMAAYSLNNSYSSYMLGTTPLSITACNLSNSPQTITITNTSPIDVMSLFNFTIMGVCKQSTTTSCVTAAINSTPMGDKIVNLQCYGSPAAGNTSCFLRSEFGMLEYAALTCT